MNGLLKSTERLQANIDRCISQLVKAREYHDTIAEQGALFEMESLMVSTVQQLQCVMDHIGDRTMVDKATDYIRRELFRFMPFVESDMKEDIINKFRKAMEE